MDFTHKDRDRLEDIVQRTRWDEVHEARQRVLDRLETIDRLQFEAGRSNPDEVSLLYQRAVQLYVQQVETLLDPVDGETTDWWTNKPIGRFDLPNGKTFVVNGLSDYVRMDEQFTVPVEVEYKPHAAHMGEMREEERAVSPPPGIHKSAFRATNRGLAEQGLEFDTRKREIGEADAGPGGGL